MAKPSNPEYRSSSQAGLSAARGPRQVPSVPKPGQPGSRFNPVVRERRVSRQEAADPNREMITSEDVPGDPTPKQAKQAQREAKQQTRRQMARESVAGVAAGGRVGAKAGSVVPGMGTAAGTAVGAGVGGSLAQSKVAREAGQPGLAFGAALPLGGVVGGAVNAKMASNVRKRQQEQQSAHEEVAEGTPERSSGPAGGLSTAEPGTASATPTEHAKKLPVSQRVKDSKFGQTVRSDEFKSGAKRVGSEAMRDVAGEAQRIKAAGGTTKEAMAGMAKSAAVGATRGIKAEMAHRKERDRQTGPAKHESAGPSGPEQSDMVGRMGEVMSTPPSTSDRSAASTEPKPLSERFNYQFEQPDAGDDAPEYGG